MGRLTLNLDEDVERQLRHFIASSYFKTHGKITEVIEKAITEYCAQDHVVETVQKVDVGKHLVLFNEDEEIASAIQLAFLSNGLSRGYHSFLVVPENDDSTGQSILRSMAEQTLPVDASSAERLLHVVKLPAAAGDADPARRLPVLSIVQEKTKDIPPPHFVVFEEPPENEATQITSVGNRPITGSFRGSLLCNHYVTAESKKRTEWFNALMRNHDGSILAMRKRSLILGLSDASRSSI